MGKFKELETEYETDINMHLYELSKGEHEHSEAKHIDVRFSNAKTIKRLLSYKGRTFEITVELKNDSENT